jgi:three-Cys-motif partner protein
MTSTDERYWAEYDGLQYAKHQLLKAYLGGWFPILSSWRGRVLYIDCHAGRGRHKTGHEGSPILALKRLRDHKNRRRILKNTEAHFFFFEIDQTNYDLLCQELDEVKPLPTNIFVHPLHTDYEKHLRKAISELRSEKKQLATTFAFVDPYGFSISMDFLNEILSFSTTELLINFMYRFIDMAITHDDQTENMNALFGNKDWKDLRNIKDYSGRSQATIDLFTNQLQAQYVTRMFMRSENGTLKYVLVHATNHPKGRRLMKESMWKVSPDGTFTASERSHPDQLVLIEPEPDLKPLKDAIWDEFAGSSIEVECLYEWLLNRSYLRKHLHEILRGYRNNGIIEAHGYEGRFAFSKNPLITFPKQREETL